MNSQAKSKDQEKLNPRVLLLEDIHPIAQKIFKDNGFEITSKTESLCGKELIEAIQTFNIIGIRSKTNISDQILEAASKSNLDVIGTFCIGTNQVDLKTAKKLGVPIFNAPYSNTRSVAEIIIAELIMLARKLGDANKDLHQGIWNKSAKNCFEVRGKNLGIVGYGHIGSQVSVMAESIGMNVFYYDIIRKLPLGNAYVIENLYDLIQKVDFLTLHVPETPLTMGMIGNKELSLMKKGSYLLNASRGSVVDIAALKKHLESQHLAGAAIDVFPEEPSSNKEHFVNPFKDLKNVILSPHIAGSTEEAQRNIGSEVALALINYFNKGSSTESVKFPKIEAGPLQSSQHRIANIHKNVPGVLSEINRAVSEVGTNIHAQHLSTDEEIGYMIMDIDQNRSSEIFERISKLPTSIKTRRLG